jgi:hypothetical protein
VAHICNPSYSGGRDQEDRCLKAALANSSRDPISKTPITKMGCGVAQHVDSEFKPEDRKKKKKKRETNNTQACFNPTTWEVEVGRSQVGGQPGCIANLRQACAT